MKDLPQEVLDVIIGYLPADDMQSFRNCSLVAKSWIYPSRRRLFRVINTLQEATLWSRLNEVSPKNVELLQHVRSLSVRIDTSLHRRSVAPTGFPHDDSPLFPRLKRLILYSGGPPSIAQLGVSLAPPHSLEYLCLCCCRVTISTLATLINHFPNLIHLKLLSLFHDVDNEPIPPLSRPLRKLTVDEPDIYDEPGILDQLLELKPQCEEVTISVFPLTAPSLTQRIIDGVEKTVKRLNLVSRMSSLGEPLTLANCQELCELKIYYLEDMEPELISTVTSTHIRKVTFDRLGPLVEHVFTSMGRDYWTELDSSLCQLVDRSEYRHWLDVEFRFSTTEKWTWKPLFEEHLPKIHEKARVRVIDTRDDTVVHCSDRARESQKE